jgi:hypothetical protein
MALSNPKYGEQKDFHSIQAGAPMQAPQVLPNAPAPSVGPASPTAPTPPTPFDAPSAHPNVPVTAGAAAGAGPGPEALNLPQGDTRDQLKAQFGPILPALIAESQSQYATQQFKDSVAALISLF